MVFFFFSSRRRHTRWPRDWSSDVCSSDLLRREGGTLMRSRRDFLKDVAALGAGAWALGACARSGAASVASASLGAVRPSLDQAGIQLFTVRDRLGDEFERTLAALAEIGYREVEPFTYGSYTPEQI